MQFFIVWSMSNQINHLNSAFSNVQQFLNENYRITVPTFYKETGGGGVCFREEVFFMESHFHLELLTQLLLRT